MTGYEYEEINGFSFHDFVCLVIALCLIAVGFWGVLK